MKQLLRTAVLGLLIVASSAMVAHAQPVSNADVCATYQHSNILLSAVATPTQKLVAQASGTGIYVCALHLSQNATGATPAITFYYGSGTTCGTGTTTIGVYGSNTAINQTTNIVDGSGGTIMTAPSGNDLCIVENTSEIPQGNIEYVQR